MFAGHILYFVTLILHASNSRFDVDFCHFSFGHSENLSQIKIIFE